MGCLRNHNLDQLFGVGALAHRGLPPLHRGLVRGSFPAPHHHDPNEMLPNFAFWVMVAAHSSAPIGHLTRFGPSCRRVAQVVRWRSRFSRSLSYLLRTSLSRRSSASRSWRLPAVDIRTRTRPAIEFVSGEEGLRPKSYYIEFSFLEFVFTVIQEYVMAPGSSFGAEGDGGTAPLAVSFPSVTQCVVSLLPVTLCFSPRRCL